MTPTPHSSRITLPNGVALSYVDVGSPDAGPVLVLLPGLTDSWRSYELVLPHLARQAPHRVIAVSLRGHGDSDKPETGYRIGDFAADVVALLDALGVRRAVLVGHSSSSLVAQRIAMDVPRIVAGLVLEGAFATLAGRKDLEKVLSSTIEPLRDPIEPAFVRKFQMGTTERPVPSAFMDVMVGESLKVPARIWKDAFASLLHEDHGARLEALRVPCLLLWGERDGLISRAEQDALARAIRGSRLAVYPGVGHTPHWEEPERFATDLGAFLRSVGSFGAARP